MSAVQAIAVVRSAVFAATLLVQVGVTRPATFNCAQLSNMAVDGAPLAARLQASALPDIDPLQAEAACLSALKANPTDPNVIFGFGRALSLGRNEFEP
jgi:hypothetical protein